MKRTIAYTTVALLASASLTVPAFALDVGVGVDAGAGASIGGNSGSNNSGNSGGLGIGGNANVNAGAQAQTGGGSSNDDLIDGNTTASTSSEANFGLLISSMRSGDDSASQIEPTTDFSSVTVVDVEDLAQGNNMQALENAKSDNGDQITKLQAAVAANADLVAGLEDHSDGDSGAVADDVIAANVEADGSITLFVE